MDYRRLGPAGPKVSVICLGSMTWGERNSEAEGHRQIDEALARGVNFIDLAEMYPTPPRAETYGESEAIFGRWLKARGGRERWVIATKAAGPDKRFPYIRDGKLDFSRRNLEPALAASLKRLGTDHVELYQLHWPERDTNIFGKLGIQAPAGDIGTPFEDILDTLGRFVEAGKIGAIGLSNETAWGAMRCLAAAERGHGPRIVSIQNPYSLLNRSFEVGLGEVALREGCGLLAYSPLGMGVLTGKYLDGDPPGARLTRYTHYRRYRGPQAVAATRAYVELARRHRLDPAQMALAFLLRQPFLTAAIVGATSTEQLATDIASAELALSEALVAEIEAIHRVYTYPAP
jgi:aryl-alcohol dehydrogenase-like predicted oxidoreductase